MIDKWFPIRYREFYDFPRAFVVEHENDLLLFDCPFSDDLDDYPTEFTVYRVDDELRARIDSLSWTGL